MAVVEMTGISMVGPREEIERVAAGLLSLGNFEPVPLDFAMEKHPGALSGSGGSRIATFRENPYDELLEVLCEIQALVSDEAAQGRTSGAIFPERGGGASARPQISSGELYDRLLPSFASLPEACGLNRRHESGSWTMPPGGSGERSIVCPSLEEASARVKGLQRRIKFWRERSEKLQEEREKLLAAKVFLDALASAGLDRTKSPPGAGGGKGRPDVASGSPDAAPGSTAWLERALDTRYLSLTFGRLSTDNYKRLAEMAGITPLLVFPVVTEKDYVLVAIFCSRDYHPEAEKLFRVVYLKEYVLQEILEGSGGAMKEYLEEQLQRSERALRALREAPRQYLERHRKELELLYCAVYAKQRIYSLCRNRGELGDVFIVSGLVPSPTLPQVEDVIERFGPNTLLLTEKDDALKRRGRRLPTLLKNTFPVRVFQEIVALYSLPSYDDIDPSPLVALSFCIFFGFMFGDVGHGLLISAGAWFLARKGILKKAFSSVLQIAGFSAAAFGFLYGSIFGSEELIPALWTSPMHGINDLILASLVTGTGFLSLGIALNILTLRRKGRIGKMLFDCEGLAGLLFYWTAVAAGAFAFTSGEGVPKPLLFALAALFLIIMCSSLLERLFFGRGEEDEGGVVHTFSVLHALLSFVSNTASFVRLAAFALNHAGLSAAVFMLGDMVRSVPGGPVFHAAVLLAGNAVIVGLEGLIVFIQTLRLEYYEFFGKFYHGGGIPFEPATWRSRE